MVVGHRAVDWRLCLQGQWSRGDGPASCRSLERCLILIPAALLAALVIKDTFSLGHELIVDARWRGLVVAVVAAWRKAPLIIVVVLAAGATALIRAAG